ncbi:MAG: DUF4143 domain-containing protein [Actinomycetia bacterium]|nr:DUF4143 domain-containing protein [Actinomycetes bacterium]
MAIRDRRIYADAQRSNPYHYRDETGFEIDANTARTGQPAFLAVVTGTEYGYTLPSGVHVVPLGALCQ